MIKYWGAFLLLFAATAWCGAYAQTPGNVAYDAYHQGAGLYIQERYGEALRAVERGLQAEPNNQRLKDLRDLLQQEQQQQQGGGSSEDQEKQEQQQNQQNGEQSEQQDENGEQQDSQQNQQQEPGEQNPDQQNPEEQENPEETGQDPQEQEQTEAGEEEAEQEEQEGQPMSEEELRKRLEEMGLTPEKAQMILDAMQANEVQYLQQLKRQSKRRQDPRKPDW